MPYHVIFDFDCDIQKAAIFELEGLNSNFVIKRVAWAGKNINNSNIYKLFDMDCDGVRVNNKTFNISDDDKANNLFNTLEEAKNYLKNRYIVLATDEQDYLLFEVIKIQRRLQENFIKFTEIIPKLDQIISENDRPIIDNKAIEKTIDLTNKYKNLVDKQFKRLFRKSKVAEYSYLINQTSGYYFTLRITAASKRTGATMHSELCFSGQVNEDIINENMQYIKRYLMRQLNSRKNRKSFYGLDK
jgi:hypothetical protein